MKNNGKNNLISNEEESGRNIIDDIIKLEQISPPSDKKINSRVFFVGIISFLVMAGFFIFALIDVIPDSQMTKAGQIIWFFLFFVECICTLGTIFFGIAQRLRHKYASAFSGIILSALTLVLLVVLIIVVRFTADIVLVPFAYMPF